MLQGLPLESSAVAAVAPRLARLDAAHFAALLTELARDNHAFRCAGAGGRRALACRLAVYSVEGLG